MMVVFWEARYDLTRLKIQRLKDPPPRSHVSIFFVPPVELFLLRHVEKRPVSPCEAFYFEKKKKSIAK